MKHLKQTNEIKFSSYGVWELLRKVYQDKEELLPKLGFKKYEDFLDWMKTGDQDTQDEFESIVAKHEKEKAAPMTESILKQLIKEEIRSVLNEVTSLQLTSEEVRRLKYLLEMKLKYYEQTGDEFFEAEYKSLTGILNKLK